MPQRRVLSCRAATTTSNEPLSHDRGTGIALAFECRRDEPTLGIPTRRNIDADNGKLGTMSSPRTSIVLVARVWRDDDGVRAILQASTTPGETAYRSLIEIRRALVDTLDDWYAATDSAEQPPTG